jgi:hypothetical protein
MQFQPYLVFDGPREEEHCGRDLDGRIDRTRREEHARQG